MKKMRVLLLCHPDLVPPTEPLIEDEFAEWATELDVKQSLERLGHQVKVCPLGSDLNQLKLSVESFKPHICFNLMEEFDGEATYDQNVVSYLEMLSLPYTGCNPRGLIIARDKAITKKILSYHNLPVPQFQVIRKKKKAKLENHLNFPVIVKSLVEEASLGISQASVVNNNKELIARVDYIHSKLHTDAILEEFIPGRELYLSIIGNEKLHNYTIWELDFGNFPNKDNAIATRNAKWNKEYRLKYNIQSRPAEISKDIESKIVELCKEAFNALELNSYVRFDLRLSPNNEVYIIEANPNPNISSKDEFALSASTSGIKYDRLIQKILNLGLSWMN